MPNSNTNLPTTVPDIIPADKSKVSIIEHGRDIHMFKITDSEIEGLASSYSSINFGLFTLCIGIIVSFVIVLTTTDLSVKLLSSFISITTVATLLGLFFGFKWLHEKSQVRQHINKIKESQ